MTKEEFLDALKAKLSEDLSESEVSAELRYYEGYIDAEVSKGRSEDEATEQLGDPILIARNIAEAPRSVYGYREASYEQGYEEATYQQEKSVSYNTSGETSDVEIEEYAPEHVFADEDEADGRTAYKERTTATFDNGFFDRGPGQQIEKTSGMATIFRNLDGSFNWGCLTALLIAVLVLVLVVTFVAKVVIAAWPAVLVAIIFGIVYTFLRGRS